MTEIIVIAGPTGTGKTRLSLSLAEAIGGEIVNYDSVQIYRGFDIGSAKPSVEERSRVPHHLFDIVDADEHFDAAQYAERAEKTCAEILRRDHVPILVGGTFFYLRAFLAGLPELPPRDVRIRARLRRIAGSSRGPARLHRWLQRADPISAGRIVPADRHRVERALEVYISSGRPISNWERPTATTVTRPHLKIALTASRSKLGPMLDDRVEEMYRRGLVEETRRLLDRFSYQCRPFAAIGYREAARLLAGQINQEEAIAETKRRTRAYAKRQLTWLRAEHNVHWVNAEAGSEDVLRSALALLPRSGRS